MKKKIGSLVMATSLTASLLMSACTTGGGAAVTPTEPTTPDEPAVVADDPAPAADGLIKVGVVNNPPSESGYREANVKDMEAVFSEANGYELKTAYSLKNDEQLQAAQGFITEGVDYLLISAAESLYEAAVVSDMAAEGDTAVQWLLDQKLDEYNVIHIQGAMGSDAQIGRTGALQKQFDEGKMNCVVQQTATWDEAEAKKIVETAINSKQKFNVIYAENDGMAKGAVAALDAAGIKHGVGQEVIVMGFDCNKWALRELKAGNWNYDGQCSPFQAQIISDLIQGKTTTSTKKIINPEKGFDATTITDDDINTYGLGE